MNPFGPAQNSAFWRPLLPLLVLSAFSELLHRTLLLGLLVHQGLYMGPDTLCLAGGDEKYPQNFRCGGPKMNVRDANKG